MQRHEFLGALESYPPKCGGKKDDGSGVCYDTEEDHEIPRLLRMTTEVEKGGRIALGHEPGTAVASDYGRSVGFAHKKFLPGDIIWKASDKLSLWKLHCLAPRHKFLPHEEIGGRCAGVNRDGGLCGLAENLHMPAPILGEKNPYLAAEVRQLQKNLATDYQAARKFAAEYRSWSRLKNSTEENRAACRQHAMEWEARAHALKLALDGLK